MNNIYTPIPFEYGGTYKSGFAAEIANLQKANSAIANQQKYSIKLIWEKPVKIGPGFENLGNTCFFNSVLQCLTYTAPLFNYVMENGHQQQCRNRKNNFFCSMCAMEEHLKKCFSGNMRILSPVFIIKNLKTIWKKFRLGSQEDSHEFLRLFLDHLNKTASLNNDEKQKNPCSVISEIFCGKLKSQVQCLECQYVSEITELFMDLSLDVQKSDSLLRSFEIFFKKEQLSGNNQYRCSKCKILVNAVKGFTIAECPNVLTIQLKRFNNNLMKINKMMHFPEHLNISKYTEKNNKNNSYELYAVLVHQGHQMWSGHYYSYIKNSNNLWYLMNDESVRMCSIEHVLKEQAYMLFYVKNESKIKNDGNMKNVPCNIVKDNQNHVKENGLPNGIPSLSSLPNGIIQIQKVSNGSNYENSLKNVKEKTEYKNYIDDLFLFEKSKPKLTTPQNAFQSSNLSTKDSDNFSPKNNNNPKKTADQEKHNLLNEKIQIKPFMNLQKSKSEEHVEYKNEKLNFSLIDLPKQKSEESHQKINNTPIIDFKELKQMKLFTSKKRKLNKLRKWDVPIKKRKLSEEVKINFCSGNANLTKIKSLDEYLQHEKKIKIEEENIIRQSLIEKNKNFFESVAKKKDEYDLDYDRGRKKKIKQKKEKIINDFVEAFNNKDDFKMMNSHLFQKKHNKKINSF